MFDEVKGFAVTAKRLFRPTTTVQYPEEKRPMSDRYRGLWPLRADPETGEPLCVACGLCARICPTSCLEMHIVPSEEGDRELEEFILRAGRYALLRALFPGLPGRCHRHEQGVRAFRPRPRRPDLHQDGTRHDRRSGNHLVGRWQRL